MIKRTLTLVAVLVLFATSIFAQDLVINEFLASNDSCYADEHGDFDDWIEIYNTGNVAVDIGGMYLTDDLAELTAYQIPTTYPDSTTIEAGGFLLLWADKEPEQGILHLDEVKLSGNGEQIGLTASDGTTIIDSLTFGEQITDISKGRETDGSSTWIFFDVPTPGTTNVANFIDDSVVIASDIFGSLSNSPNPFNPSTTVLFQINKTDVVQFKIFNIGGQLVYKSNLGKITAGEHEIYWNGKTNDGRNLSSGMYLYQISSSNSIKTNKMLMLK